MLSDVEWMRRSVPITSWICSTLRCSKILQAVKKQDAAIDPQIMIETRYKSWVKKSWSEPEDTKPLFSSNIPIARIPHRPPDKWICTVYTGSSISILSSNLTHSWYPIAETIPIIAEDVTETYLEVPEDAHSPAIIELTSGIGFTIPILPVFVSICLI